MMSLRARTLFTWATSMALLHSGQVASTLSRLSRADMMAGKRQAGHCLKQVKRSSATGELQCGQGVAWGSDLLGQLLRGDHHAGRLAHQRLNLAAELGVHLLPTLRFHQQLGVLEGRLRVARTLALDDQCGEDLGGVWKHITVHQQQSVGHLRGNGNAVPPQLRAHAKEQLVGVSVVALRLLLPTDDDRRLGRLLVVLHLHVQLEEVLEVLRKAVPTPPPPLLPLPPLPPLPMSLSPMRKSNTSRVICSSLAAAAASMASSRASASSSDGNGAKVGGTGGRIPVAQILENVRVGVHGVGRLGEVVRVVGALAQHQKFNSCGRVSPSLKVLGNQLGALHRPSFPDHLHRLAGAVEVVQVKANDVQPLARLGVDVQSGAKGPVRLLAPRQLRQYFRVVDVRQKGVQLGGVLRLQVQRGGGVELANAFVQARRFLVMFKLLKNGSTLGEDVDVPNWVQGGGGKYLEASFDVAAADGVPGDASLAEEDVFGGGG
ncbi:hypothetical protein TYRP_005635 [Tyrophagus putrescentiae]|nr:hypothetical protein TYRP_005635 [Tyrophagus putrescentiae]